MMFFCWKCAHTTLVQKASKREHFHGKWWLMMALESLFLSSSALKCEISMLHRAMVWLSVAFHNLISLPLFPVFPPTRLYTVFGIAQLSREKTDDLIKISSNFSGKAAAAAVSFWEKSSLNFAHQHWKILRIFGRKTRVINWKFLT